MNCTNCKKAISKAGEYDCNSTEHGARGRNFPMTFSYAKENACIRYENGNPREMYLKTVKTTKKVWSFIEGESE